jgi:hypothetical protein
MFPDDYSLTESRFSRLEVTDSNGTQMTFHIGGGVTCESDYEMGVLRIETSGPVAGFVNNDTEANEAIRRAITDLQAINPEGSAYLRGMQHTADMIALIMEAKQAGTVTINH